MIPTAVIVKNMLLDAIFCDVFFSIESCDSLGPLVQTILEYLQTLSVIHFTRAYYVSQRVGNKYARAPVRDSH